MSADGWVYSFEQVLKEKAVSKLRLRAVVGRLLANGVLMREESRTEERLYDDAARIKDLLSDYFQLVGFRLVHDEVLEYFRLHPPSDDEANEAESVYGEKDEEDEGAPVRRLRAQVNRDFAASVLVLRFIYQSHLNSGEALNDNMEAITSVGDFVTACQNLLGHALAQTQGARKGLFEDLRKHRLIRTGADLEAQAADGIIAIRRYIVGFVTDDAVSRALSRHKASERSAREEPVEGNPSEDFKSHLH